MRQARLSAIIPQGRGRGKAPKIAAYALIGLKGMPQLPGSAFLKAAAHTARDDGFAGLVRADIIYLPTVSFRLAFLPSMVVAVMVAVPALTGVIRPFASTFATFLLLLVHFTTCEASVG